MNWFALEVRYSVVEVDCRLSAVEMTVRWFSNRRADHANVDRSHGVKRGSWNRSSPARAAPGAVLTAARKPSSWAANKVLACKAWGFAMTKKEFLGSLGAKISPRLN